MFMKKIKYIFILSFISLGALAQQQGLYSNYMLNNYAYNPAVAGTKAYTQANLNYRNQWTGFDDAPKTGMLSLYGTFKKKTNMAMGGLILSDKTGLLKRTAGYMSYAYHVKLNKKLVLGMGLSVGMIQYRIRLYDAKVADAGDDILTGNVLATNVFDANAGVLLYSGSTYIGLSSYQIAGNKINWTNSQSKLARYYYLSAGHTFTAGKKFEIQPNLLVRATSPTSLSQVEFSLRGIYKKSYWLGASIRVYDSYSVVAGFKVKEKVSVGYAYDMGNSNLKNYHSGSHELMLIYSFIKKKAANADEDEYHDIDNSIKSTIHK